MSQYAFTAVPFRFSQYAPVALPVGSSRQLRGSWATGCGGVGRLTGRTSSALPVSAFQYRPCRSDCRTTLW